MTYLTWQPPIKHKQNVLTVDKCRIKQMAINRYIKFL